MLSQTREAQKPSETVLEALAAVGLTGSVVQFVDFAVKINSKGNKYHKSTDGVLPENREYLGIAENFARLNQGLGSALNASRSCQTTRGFLQTVAMSCQTITLQFKAALDQLMISGTRGKWKIIRQATKACWSKEKIEEMLDKLRIVREDFVVHLLVVMR